MAVTVVERFRPMLGLGVWVSRLKCQLKRKKLALLFCKNSPNSTDEIVGK